MKKFIVDKTEIKQFEDGMKYIAIYDKDNNDWYEELKKFKSDTLKVMYNKDTLLVLTANKDASMIAPTVAGDVVEEIPYQEFEVTSENYFVGGKIVKLNDCEIVKDGKVVFDRQSKIENIKVKLKDLKEGKIRLGVKVKEGIYHPVRDTDKLNLSMAKETWTGNRKWKFYDKENNGIIDDLTLDIIKKIFLDGEKILNGAILGETQAENALEKMTDKELKNINIEKYFEKYYKTFGGI